MAKILRVDMGAESAAFEEVPDKYRFARGRWLTSSLVVDEVQPTCHPLGPGNKLIFSPGIVTGTTAPTSARISVGGKSPLTGGIKESNAGTKFATMQARLGIAGIVIQGQPKNDSQYVLHIDKDGARLLPEDGLRGLGTYATTDALIGKYGNVGVCCIGPAGEMRMAMAGICFNDLENRASRYSGRGGLGAVMGSKGLKAIVVNSRGAPAVPIANKDLFEMGRKKLTSALRSHDITKPKGGLNTYGTAVLVNMLNEAGGLPTRNFSRGRFEKAADIAGEAIFEGNKARLGKELYNHACSPGCIIQCSNTWHSEDGSEAVSCIEYETVWAFGPDCEIGDLDVIGRLTWLCNDIGIDTIEAGGTVAVAMEGGVIPFGDGQGAIGLLEEVRKGTPLGHIIAAGAAVTGKVFGVVRVPVVKGQSMPAYDPRVVKGIGVTYATSTMGADHTAGYTIAPEILGVSGKVDSFDVKKAELSRNFQTTTAFIDSIGHCLFIAFAILDFPEGFEGMIEECNGVLGTNWTAEDVGRIGAEILVRERDFNKGAGFTSADDRLPEFMKYEPLPPHNEVWNVSDEELDAVHGGLASR
jgi:aldehyde:ferredoxin oxidoreductase